MTSKHLTWSLLPLMLAAPVHAQQTRSAPPGTPPPAATIADAAWLTGAWTGTGLGGQVTEVYSAPAAGQMSAHFEMVADGKVAFYELMQVVEQGGSLVYRLKHFGGDLTGWEDKAGRAAVAFPLVARDGDDLYFDGLTFDRTGPDSMILWVAIKGKDGQAREERFDYRRARVSSQTSGGAP